MKLRVALLLVTCLVALSGFCDGVLVCRDCGYENAGGANLCVHCKAKLPVLKVEKPSTDPAGEPGASRRMKFIDPKVVESEITMARQYSDTGEFELANLFARNAAALEMLVDPAARGDRSERIAEFRKKSETGGMTVTRPCSACGGSGKYVMETQGLNNTTTTMEVAGRSCPKCGGSGNVLKPSTIDERKYKLGRGMSRYTVLQQGRKYSPVGSAWIPAGLEGSLSSRQSAQLKRFVALPCSDCLGLGRTDCAKCKGHGEIKCTGQGCVNGKVEVVDEGTLVKKSKMKRLVKCKLCGGTALVVCAECRGKGSLVCKKCNGSGERALCDRCGGQGCSDCRRCQGTGKVKDLPCQDCRGEGVLPCTTCNGDGRKR